jgi:CRISPR-associated protein Cas2
MSRAPRYFIVCYDVRDPRRLRRVYRVMRGFGDHVQFSVFRCLLSETQRARMEGRLRDEIDVREDQVLIICLGTEVASVEASIHTLGQPLLHLERLVNLVWADP